MAFFRSRTTVTTQKTDKYLHDIEAALAGDRRADPDGFLMKLKPLFKECAEMRTVPVPYRLEVICTQIAELMRVLEVDTGAVAVSEGNVTPDLYIVLKGTFEARAAKTGAFRHGTIYKQFDAFGFLTPLSQIDWVPCTVKALEPSKLVTVSRVQLSDFFERITHLKERTELRDFVVATVPGARYLGMGGKEKVMGYFDTESFKKGDILLREGRISDHAYIIRSGECLKTTQSSSPRPRRLSPLKSLSPVSRAHVLSLVTPQHWVGEECLIYNTPLEYTVVAAGRVTALRIHRDNFNEKLPKETIQALQLHVDSKRAWKAAHQQRIQDTLSRVSPIGESSVHSQSLILPPRSKQSSSILKPQILDKSAESGNDSFFLTEKGKREVSVSPLKSVDILAKALAKEHSEESLVGKAAFFREKNPFAAHSPSLQPLRRYPSTRSVRKSLSPTKSSVQSVRERFGYNATPDERINSPNPSALWMKKHSIDPAFMASIQRVSKGTNEY